MKQNLRAGILFALGASLIYAVGAVITKMVTEKVDIPTIAFFRQLFGLAVLAPVLLHKVRRGGRTTLQSKRPGLLWLRGCISLFAMYALLFALWKLPVSDAILLSYTRPLFLPFIAWFWLRKRIERHIWVGLVLGFVGVALILKPTACEFDLGALAGLVSGILGAFAFLLIRRLGRTDPPYRIMAWHSIITLLLTSLPMAFFRQPFPPIYWLGLAIAGSMGALYQYCLTSAFRYARSTLVSSVLYSAVVFGIVLDAIVWQQLPDVYAIIGILLVIGGSITAIWWQRERIAPGEQSTVAAVRPGKEK